MNKYKLCYICENAAYFTTQELDKQWGDDWGDAPYEHNAGEPYRPLPDQRGLWDIKKIFFDSDLCEPCSNYRNSPYTVKGINEKKIAWLSGGIYENYNEIDTEIWAGCTLDEFIELIQQEGGQCYTAVTEVLK